MGEGKGVIWYLGEVLKHGLFLNRPHVSSLQILHINKAYIKKMYSIIPCNKVCSTPYSGHYSDILSTKAFIRIHSISKLNLNIRATTQNGTGLMTTRIHIDRVCVYVLYLCDLQVFPGVPPVESVEISSPPRGRLP